MIQFIVTNEVPLGLVRQVPGLGFVIQYHSKPEVLKNWFSLVWVRAR
jgi:hypothetical protein